MNVVIVGAGIMGVTLATIAKELAPDLEITILERLHDAAHSNTGVFNNAGTGHEANCELNYTPVDEEEISVEKALKIHAQFNVAKQFWAYLVDRGIVSDPGSFIQQVQHCTLVSASGMDMLRLRHKEMTAHHFFDHMHYSEDHDEIQSWIPLCMEDRARSERMAATMIEYGTDVNFESVTQQMARHLEQRDGVNVHYGTHVNYIHKSPTGRWLIEASCDKQKVQYKADVLFVGAGGGAFPLLKQSGLPERSRYAGFPVGGRFLLAEIDENAAKHYNAKTYGKAKVGAPPMSVPHLDLRAAHGKHYLLFGPFATFMPKLEKGRSVLDFIRAMRPHDIPSMMKVAKDHYPLVKYLVSETFKGKSSKMDDLEQFAPGATRKFQWREISAGQRVQIIKDGDLQMGTEIVVSEDRSFGTLLGASPGASTSPEIMLRCMEKVLPWVFETEHGKKAAAAMFPIHDLKTLMKDADAYRQARDDANRRLGIGVPPRSA